MNQQVVNPEREVYGVWASTTGTLISYRYLGTNSEFVDRHHAVGSMPLRSDMRSGRGVLAAPLAIALLDVGGICVDRLFHASPTHVVIEVFDDAAGVKAVRLDGSIVREAKRQMFTEAIMRDAADSGRTIAIGMVDWANIAPTPEGFAYNGGGAGAPDVPPMPPLPEVYGARRLDAGGYSIDQLSPEVGLTILHHGPQLVTTEAHAFETAAAIAGIDRLALRTYSLRLVRPGRVGPFVTSAEVITQTPELLACRVTLTDTGAGDTISIATVRFDVR